MRTPFIAGNWKMNTTLEETEALVKAMRPGLDALQGVEKVVCPPFVSLAKAKDLLKGSQTKLGAQNMYFEPKGAFTGEVSPAMLAGLCQFVILGHSERRQYFGETDAVIAKKVAAACKVGLTPILCVGERLDEKEKGLAQDVITRQVKGSLAGITLPRELVVAYEPVWAIGTGKACDSATATTCIGLIRRLLTEQYGVDFAQRTRILYGGSVTPDNVAEFMAQPEIDGALVGGASLKAPDFVRIVELSAKAKKASS